ncbi:FecCD family ABC transporter permease [Pseudonocardia humida]|uniref:Iron chelate uptake ABC transporter family permease subunit n=1 Tax=Pseudonocardia humida TaxID=2800819 RepID=A0ABT1ADI8_9PSEU|nr:iron chelate uptake ABC transporter family permease subunit [Pseudonocardia humida]MCO1660824.1 iron chelate uptake ABC transporter family permease subunit [Pseudonocardia humida]MCO1661038.1 iron chelate uptake ABC transporter family permease subunit [Pseudonocardia humida]
MSTTTLEAVTRGRVRRSRRRQAVLTAFCVAAATMVVVSLMAGRTFYPPGDVLRVVLGETVPGASFAVGELRLPRTVLALLTGVCFGMGGVTFQTMMRNPLASPDIIGISSAASAAAAFAIIVLGLGEAGVSVFAIVAALGVAVVIYVLSFKDGVAGTRLVLIGIGIAAMLHSATSYILNQAGQWDLQAATRWLNGSLNGSTWDESVPVLIALVVFGPVLLGQARGLTMLQLGDDTAAALGTRLELTRLVSIVSAVGLIAFATSATGPIAFVAFLAGPIAARLVGPGGSLLVPSGLVGALLVLVADFLGQFAFGTRFPVGVITGVLGAPYLIYLLVRSNRAGGSL